jgi:hypothetical protein
MTTALNLKAPLASPTFTGTVSIKFNKCYSTHLCINAKNIILHRFNYKLESSSRFKCSNYFDPK